MSTAQKTIKYLAIALAIFLIISIFSGIYFAIGTVGGIIDNDNDYCNINSYKDDAKVLCVSTGATELKILKGKEAKVETNNKHIKYEIKNNKIFVREEKHSFNFKTNSNYVNVYIPEDLDFSKVYISNGAGKMSVSDITTDDLELDLGAGVSEINNIVTFNKTKIDGGAGEFTINNSNLSNLELDAGVGKLTLNAYLLNDTEIDAGVGEININLLDSIDNYKIKTECGVGSITINGKSAKDENTYGKGTNFIDIDGGVGSIKISSNEQ